MTTMPPTYRERVTTDPRVLAGKPVITGTRIPVSLILNLLAHGYDIAQVLEAYPNLVEDDVRAAIAYAGARLDLEDVRTLAE